MNDLLLMTPEIASTTAGVKAAMQIDLAPQSEAFLAVSTHLRQNLLRLAQVDAKTFTSVLLPGDDATILEATLQTVIPRQHARVLVGVNGNSGAQIVAILEYLAIPHVAVVGPQGQLLDQQTILAQVHQHAPITHFIMCHQDATAGVLNPLAPVFNQLHDAGITTILDARATFGGVPIDCSALGIDYLVTVFHHALHSVPGFGAVIANRRKIAKTADYSRSVALDLYEQLAYMELYGSAWRHGAPTQAVVAADRALCALCANGGVTKRYQTLRHLQHQLSTGMDLLGFHPLCAPVIQSPLMTAFAYPNADFDFEGFAAALQARGFAIAKGIAKRPSFRIATWGLVDRSEIKAFLSAVQQITQPGHV